MDEGFLWLLILLGSLVVLMAIAVVLLWRVVRLLKPARSAPVASAAGDLAERKQEERAHKRHFEEFLAEDPSRAQLLKSEQSAAFRQWRQDRGFTWGR
jgi:hypothetical protein